MAGKSFQDTCDLHLREWGRSCFPRPIWTSRPAPGRKVRNFIVVQYGRLVHRPGLEYIAPTIVPEMEP